MKVKYEGFPTNEGEKKPIRSSNDFGEALRTHDFATATEYIEHLQSKKNLSHRDERNIDQKKYTLAASFIGQEMLDEAENIIDSMEECEEKSSLQNLISKKRQE